MQDRQRSRSSKHPVTYTRERVVDAAFEQIRENGWQDVSARSIADRLGSSTMPIYSHLRSIAEVERALRSRARALLRDFQMRSWTEDALLNMAFGYVAFARDERNLFRFLYLERPEVIESGDLSNMKKFFEAEHGDREDVASALAAMEAGGLEPLIRHSWIFTHGLAMLVSSGSLGNCPDDTILRLLRNAGEAFYLQAVRPWENSSEEEGGSDE
jgi:AcrR family transcriptional regulator